MSDSDRVEFLAGERPDDVVLYFADEALTERDELASYGEPLEGGVVLVLPGERGRSVFATATGTNAMTFAGQAMGTEGHVDRDLTGGRCPEADDHPEEHHRSRYLLAFAKERNEEVGGRYAEGDVIHAYAQCDCGVTYSDRWVAGDENKRTA